MKIFNSAAGLIEKHFPAILKRVEKARLFLFPGRAHEVLPKDLDVETTRALHESFFLPFPTIAVEDTATCTVMWDTEKDQAGLEGIRGFIEIEPFTPATVGEFKEGQDDEETARIKERIAQYPKGSTMISEGRFGPVKLNPHGKIEFAGVVLWAALATKDGGILGVDIANRPKDKESLRRLQVPILENVDTSLQEVFYFNAPNRFIVEECPIKAMARWKKRRERAKRKKPVKDRIRRRHERPIYTLLRPNEIRVKLGLPPLTVGGPRRPHERRRHYRTYRDDRYVNMRDKTVIIPATWIGPSHATIGNRRYRILLDK